MTVATDPRKTGVEAGMTLLARSYAAVANTGNTSETVLATVAIPAGAMGANGSLLIFSSWSNTNNANGKTVRVRFGGAAGTAYLSTSLASFASASDIRRIGNRNSASSQVSSYPPANLGGTGASTGALVTSTVDTAVAQDLVFSSQLSVGTDTQTLESYEVWLVASQ